MKDKDAMGLLLVLITMILFIAVSVCIGMSRAEEIEPEYHELYVLPNHLNGRATPRKTGRKEALFDYGDILTPTGKWSKDHKWVEVEGGEPGTVWVYYEYVSERFAPIIAQNLGKQKVRIRSIPFDGKTTGYLKSGQKIEVTQIVLGWGKTSKGWIDMSYLVWEDE